jgi:hypothetical protein
LTAMKFYGSILALFVLQGATAFVVQGPQSLKVSPAFANVGSFEGQQTTNVNGGMAGAGTAGGISKASSSNPYGAKKTVVGGDIWDTASPITVQGGSLRTWSFATPAIDRVQVLLRSEGRPVHANVELWQGPDNTPMKMGVYVEDGSLRTFNAIIETPGAQNAIAIRNTGQMEFPMQACVEADMEYADRHGSVDLIDFTQRLAAMGTRATVQGGAVRTYPFDPSVESVQIMLTTDGRPLNARIEMLQGPNNKKQVIDLYIEDGKTRPFFMVFETPGSGNVVRIVNTATVEFPMFASVEPYTMRAVNDRGPSEGGDYFVLDRQF